MDTHLIDIEDFKVNYIEIGSGEPVILLHGLGGSWEDWLELIPALSPVYRVCAIDFPGFGKSPPPPRQHEYDLVFVANFMRKFMDAKGYQRVFLVGNSMGGGIALRCAMDDPERIQGVVLANGAGLGKEISGFNRALAFPGIARLAIPFIEKEHVRAIWKSMFFNPELITPAMIDRTWEWIQKTETKKFLIYLYPKVLSIWGQKYLLLPEAEKIRCPVLITWGINDAVLPVLHAVNAFQAIHSAQLTLIRDCGHVPQLEQAEIFNQSVMKFLKYS